MQIVLTGKQIEIVSMFCANMAVAEFAAASVAVKKDIFVMAYFICGILFLYGSLVVSGKAE